MSECRYKVPIEMEQAAMAKLQATFTDGRDDVTVAVVLEVALRWLSENPVVPSEEHWRLFQRDVRNDLCQDGAMAFAEWFQRIMFRQSEEEVPESHLSICCALSTAKKKILPLVKLWAICAPKK